VIPGVVTSHVEGQPACWLSAQPCRPQEVAGESHNGAHIESIVRLSGGRIGVPLVAWLTPEPHNPYDPNAVMVWVCGGKVGYLPRVEAVHWHREIGALQYHSRLPVACCSHVELPAEHSDEITHQVVLWLPLLPGQTGLALSAHDMTAYMTRAMNEPWSRAERQRILAEQQRTRLTLRREELSARFGDDATVRILARELWVGENREMVVESFGQPESEEEKVLKSKVKRIMKYVGECPKCEGSGYIPEFAHIEDGACFSCRGTGKGRSSNLVVRLENGSVVGWDKRL
jgi:hypothetical protein